MQYIKIEGNGTKRNMRIEIKNLTKIYGDFTALDEINLSFTDGVNGLLGANGAGKTTLMKILVGILDKTSGEIIIDGMDMKNKAELRKNIGYIPQKFSFYPNMSIYEMMDYFCVLNKIKQNRTVFIEQILENVHLSDDMSLKIKELSGGMVQRLGIAAALIKSPKILILDEPTAGLDPKERRHFNHIITSIAEDRIILLSSHIVSDIEETCKNITILNHGRVIFSGNKDTLIEGCGNHIGNFITGEEKDINFISDLTDAYVYKIDMDEVSINEKVNFSNIG